MLVRRMQRSPRALAALAWLFAAPTIAFSFAACGGNAPQPTPPVATLPSPPKGGTDTAPAVDLSAVNTPDTVFLWGRASKPARSLDMLSTWIHQPIQGQEPLKEMIGEKLGNLADLDQPVDFAVYVKPGMMPRFAIVLSVPLKGSVESIQPQLGDRYSFVKGPNGVIELAHKSKPVRRPDDDEDGDEPEDDAFAELGRCALAPAFGPAAARVVCARESNVRDLLVPYLTRTVTRQSFPADIHVELRQEAFKEFLTKNRNGAGMIAQSVFGRDVELREATTAGITDLIDLGLDAQHGTIDINLDDKQGTGDARLTFQRKQSTLGRALVSHPEKADAPPAAFGKLPSDSAAAAFVHGFDAGDLTSAKALGAKAIENLLQKRQELDATDRKAFADFYGHFADLLTSPMVYGRGVDVVAASAALNAWQSKKGDATKAMNALSLVAGWDALGIEAPIAKVSAPIKELFAAINRPHVQAWMKKEQGSTPIDQFKTSAPVAGLPAGNLHFEIVDFNIEEDFNPPPQPSTQARPSKPNVVASKLQLVLVPDGDRTWVLSAMDLPTLVTKAKAILAGTDNLGKRADLEVLRTTKSNAGGFVSLRGIGMKLPIAWASRSPGWALDDDPLFGMSTSDAGMVAVPFWFAEEAPKADAASGALTLSVRVPRAEIADFLSVGVRLFR